MEVKHQAPKGSPLRVQTPLGFDMDALVGSILLIGVLLSLVLLASGAIWHWFLVGQLSYDYRIGGTDLLKFVITEIGALASGHIRPRILISSGIAVLLITPYVRVLASMVYFAVEERDFKYTLFTAFVLGVLTYSLMLR